MTRLDPNPHRHRYSPDWPLAGMAPRGESARDHRECIAILRDERRTARLWDTPPLIGGEILDACVIEGDIDYAPHGAPLYPYR